MATLTSYCNIVAVTQQSTIVSAKDIDLPEEAFFDSAQPEQTVSAAGSLQHLSMNPDYSSKFSGKSTLATSANALIEERHKSRESSQQ